MKRVQCFKHSGVKLGIFFFFTRRTSNYSSSLNFRGQSRAAVAWRNVCLLDIGVAPLQVTKRQRLRMWRWSFSGVYSKGCVTLSNPDLLSSSETRKKKLKKARIWMSSMSESHWCIHFTRKWRADTLQPGLEFDILRSRLKNGIFKMHISHGWTVYFLGTMLWVFWKRESRPILWLQYHPILRKRFFNLLDHSLWDAPVFFLFFIFYFYS